MNIYFINKKFNLQRAKIQEMVSFLQMKIKHKTSKPNREWERERLVWFNLCVRDFWSKKKVEKGLSHSLASLWYLEQIEQIWTKEQTKEKEEVRSVVVMQTKCEWPLSQVQKAVNVICKHDFGNRPREKKSVSDKNRTEQERERREIE